MSRYSVLALAVALTALVVSACATIDVSDGLETSGELTVGLNPDGGLDEPIDPVADTPESTPTPEANQVDLEFNGSDGNSIAIVPGDDNSPLTATDTDSANATADGEATTTPDPNAVPTPLATATPDPAATTGPTATPAPTAEVATTSVTAGSYYIEIPGEDDGLNVRSEPNADIIAVIAEGDAITVVGEARRIGSTTWAKVQPADGGTWGTGWVAFQFLKAGAAPPTATPDPDATPTETPTPDPDATPTETPTPDPDATATPTPDPDATATPTPDPDATTTPTPTPTPDPDATATPTPEATPTPTPGPTVDPANVITVSIGNYTIELDTPDTQGAPILSEPRSDSSVLSFAPRGSLVEIVSNQGVRSGGVALVEIQYLGTRGWVNAAFLEAL